MGFFEHPVSTVHPDGFLLSVSFLAPLKDSVRFVVLVHR